MEPSHVAVACPWVPMEMQVLQLRHGCYQPGGQRGQPVVRQIEVPQSGDVEMAHQSEGGESCWVKLLNPVAFQLQHPQRGEALEGVRVDELQVVVVQV